MLHQFSATGITFMGEQDGAHEQRLKEAISVLLDLDTLPFTPMNDLPRQLVYCDAGGAVRTTIVAGEIVVEKGITSD